MNAPGVWLIAAIIVAWLVGSGKMGMLDAIVSTVVAGVILLIINYALNPFGKSLEKAIDKRLNGPSKIIVAAVVAIIILGAWMFGKAYYSTVDKLEQLPLTAVSSKTEPQSAALAPIATQSEPVTANHDKVAPYQVLSRSHIKLYRHLQRKTIRSNRRNQELLGPL